jgi:hypothetical protein
MAIAFEKKDGTRRIRFTSDVSHDGQDYGPQYDEQECEVDSVTAGQYVRQGRAEYVEPKENDSAPGLDTKSASAAVAGKAPPKAK